MQHATLLTISLSLCAALCGCFDSDDVMPDDLGTDSETGAEALSDLPLEDSAALRLLPPPDAIPAGALWGPCDLDDEGQEVGGWGCDGAPGEGLACLRPVSDEPITLCAPQTWDLEIADDCSGLPAANFGGALKLLSGAYCVPACETNADCLAVQRCSPASHFCAWL